MEGTARVWDAATGAAVGRFDGHAGMVYALAVAPDGRSAATADGYGRDVGVRRWAVPSGAPIGSIASPGLAAVSLAFSADGATLFGGDRSGRLLAWDARSGELLRETQAHKRHVFGLKLAPGGLALTAAWDGAVRVWDAGTGAAVGEFPPHAGPVRCLAVAPGRRRAAGVGADGRAAVVTLDGAPEAEFAHPTSVVACAWVGPNRLLTGSGAIQVSDRRSRPAGFDAVVRLWDVDGRRELARWEAPAVTLTLAVFPDGRRVAVWHSDGTVVGLRLEE